MLKTPLEQLAYIIEKAREFDAETPPSTPARDQILPTITMSRSSKTRVIIRRDRNWPPRWMRWTTTSE